MVRLIFKKCVQSLALPYWSKYAAARNREKQYNSTMAHDEWIWYRTDHVTNSAFAFLSVSLSKKRFVRYLQSFRFNKILLPIEFNSIYIHYGVFCCILTIFDEKVFSEMQRQTLHMHKRKKAICEGDIIICSKFICYHLFFNQQF